MTGVQTCALPIFKVNQRVTVTVLEVDIDRKRISLSMKTGPKAQASND